MAQTISSACGTTAWFEWENYKKHIWEKWGNPLNFCALLMGEDHKPGLGMYLIFKQTHLGMGRSSGPHRAPFPCTIQDLFRAKGENPQWQWEVAVINMYLDSEDNRCVVSPHSTKKEEHGASERGRKAKRVSLWCSEFIPKINNVIGYYLQQLTAKYVPKSLKKEERLIWTLGLLGP